MNGGTGPSSGDARRADGRGGIPARRRIGKAPVSAARSPTDVNRNVSERGPWPNRPIPNPVVRGLVAFPLACRQRALLVVASGAILAVILVGIAGLLVL